MPRPHRAALPAALLVGLALAACTPLATAGGDPAGDDPDAGRGGTDVTVRGPAVADLEDFGPPPALVDLDGWIDNGTVTGLDDLRGRVAIVWFWTFGCRNCTNTLPNLQALRAAHDDDDVAIIGIHAPEFAHEEDPDDVAAAMEDLGVTWPVALDTDHTNFRAWQDPGGNFWPRTFVLDQAGSVRFDHVGEGAYDRLNATVAALVADPVG